MRVLSKNIATTEIGKKNYISLSIDIITVGFTLVIGVKNISFQTLGKLL